MVTGDEHPSRVPVTPIPLVQVAVVFSSLTICNSTYLLGAIRVNRPEVGPREITRRTGGSLETKGHAVKWLPAPRGYKKKCDPVRGHTSWGAMIDVVGETRHWGTSEAFQRHTRGEGTRYDCEALGLWWLTMKRTSGRS